MMIITLAAGTMLVLGVFMAWVLGWANVAFHVEIDPRQEAVQEALPGANCGGCGYVGCNEYAEAVVLGETPINKCTVGGVSCTKALADILGVEVEASWPSRAVVHCCARLEDRLGRHPYRGEKTCRAANMVAGVQGCTYGCLSIGDCQRSCQFDAIHVIDGVTTVDYHKCVGCGACEKVCPRHIISMVPFKTDQMVIVACSNSDFGKDVKKVCKVGCIGCKRCQKLAAGLITIEDNRPHIDYENYDPESMADLEMAVDKCPAKRLMMVGVPTQRDLDATADKEVPAVIEPDFHTTVDDTEYRG